MKLYSHENFVLELQVCNFTSWNFTRRLYILQANSFFWHTNLCHTHLLFFCLVWRFTLENKKENNTFWYIPGSQDHGNLSDLKVNLKIYIEKKTVLWLRENCFSFDNQSLLQPFIYAGVILRKGWTKYIRNRKYVFLCIVHVLQNKQTNKPKKRELIWQEKNSSK